jgi:hypothetical protein
MDNEKLADVVNGANMIIDMTKVCTVEMHPSTPYDEEGTLDVILSVGGTRHRFTIPKEIGQGIVNVWANTRVNKSFTYCFFIAKKGKCMVVSDMF